MNIFETHIFGETIEKFILWRFFSSNLWTKKAREKFIVLIVATTDNYYNLNYNKNLRKFHIWGDRKKHDPVKQDYE